MLIFVKEFNHTINQVKIMELLNQLKRDLNPNDGIAIATDTTGRLTDPLRETIKTADKIANELAATLLTRCTTLQLVTVVNNCKLKQFYSLKTQNIDLCLNGIWQKLSTKTWRLDFKSSDPFTSYPETYFLSDLGLDDKLSLIDIIEFVLLNS